MSIKLLQDYRGRATDGKFYPAGTVLQLTDEQEAYLRDKGFAQMTSEKPSVSTKQENAQEKKISFVQSLKDAVSGNKSEEEKEEVEGPDEEEVIQEEEDSGEDTEEV